MTHVDIPYYFVGITLNMLTPQIWTDHKLKWNVSDYGGVDSTRVHPKHIWTPDIALFNRSVRIDPIRRINELGHKLKRSDYSRPTVFFICLFNNLLRSRWPNGIT